jgi:2-polyprenyl-3-methyl-5-hydroxy-6-metoxy-1,4-benzoquinol methylase
VQRSHNRASRAARREPGASIAPTDRIDKLAIPRPELPIVDAGADARFRAMGSELGVSADNFWIARYVDFELCRSKHLFASSLLDVRGKTVLELGCNVGATAIVLAYLGARVTAIDVNAVYVRAARLNAQRYGFAASIEFAHVPDTTRLPFNKRFDVVSCNSVLEYVPPEKLRGVLRELDRVLAPGGVIAILGTSNRLWPKERHSRRWLTNYLPRALDPLLPENARCRGVTPWSLRRAFPDYDDVVLRDRGRGFLAARSAMGLRGVDSSILSAAAKVTSRIGVSIGMLLPSIVMLLQKPGAARANAAT